MTARGRSRRRRSTIDWLAVAGIGILTAAIAAVTTVLTIVTVFASTWVSCSATVSGTSSCVVTKDDTLRERRHRVADVVGVIVDERETDSGSPVALRLMTGSGPRGPFLRDTARWSASTDAERLSTWIPGTRLGGSATLIASPSTGPAVILETPAAWLFWLMVVVTGVCGAGMILSLMAEAVVKRRLLWRRRTMSPGRRRPGRR